ncbi:ImmA/IrrE family metallo-endopeptidase [Thermus brockianus]|jgi:Zn-dependent peptidase ImmA (M78 family)/DNA-binding XRE family transcriptional regulator|uniref:HTH cro/C1-type domain-containing protein n=1 Tax=Thermus brockianus TaxID=56956 RepID=A0ABM7XMI0_THEBO|nr:ImmA/IrrE family metallo-endopeptidase [Thermus brockianus]BDG17562.1 hypothetical protein TbrSNM41_22960 [Thermus brockianus]
MIRESHLDRVLARKLKEAREQRGLTQEAVAQILGVSRETVALWEGGARIPSLLYLGDLAKLYGVKEESFLTQGPLEFLEDLRALLRKEEEALLDPGVRLELRRWLDFLNGYAELLELAGEAPYLKAPPKELKPKEAILTDLRQASSQAIKVREYFKLGQDALPELYTFLDNVGVLVYKVSLPQGAGVWGAFYRHPRLGYSVLVNVNATPGRQAFTLAHELAHALYHNGFPGIVCRRENLAPEEAEVERFANAWAAHFLVPGKALREGVRRLGRLDPEVALLLAHHFRVSYALLLFRLRNEGLLSEEQLKEWVQYAPQDLARRLGLNPEPYGLPQSLPNLQGLKRYPPSVLQLVRKSVEEDLISVSEAAELLNVNSYILEKELLSAGLPKEENPEVEELVQELGFVSPGRRGKVLR